MNRRSSEIFNSSVPARRCAMATRESPNANGYKNTSSNGRVGTLLTTLDNIWSNGRVGTPLTLGSRTTANGYNATS